MKRSWKAAAFLLALAAAATALAPVGAGAANVILHDATGDPAPVAFRYLYRIQKDEDAIAQARSDQAYLATQQQGEDPLANLFLQVEKQNAAYRYRDAIRTEQVDLLRVAVSDDVYHAVVNAAPQPLAGEIADAVAAWRAMWRLAGIDEYNLVKIHPRPLGNPAPSETLLQYYQDSAGHYQIDWTYLAAINFIESDFGRVTGPSSAGAIGPMQFMPATWAEYGEGDINNPRDAINAAARYLFLSGGRRSMDAAIYAYNHDNDYVAAVDSYADAIRRDPSWLDRFYYWNTAG